MPDPSADRTPQPDAGFDAPFDEGPAGLDAQIEARLRASMEDARAQAPNRLAAAAKAVALLLDERDREAGSVDVAAPPAPPTPPPTPVAVSAATTPDEAIDLRPARPEGTPLVPTGGPAAAVSSAFAASLNSAQPVARPLFELRTLGREHPDPKAENLLVFAERLEHRDRHGRLRQEVFLRDVTTVTTSRRLSGASVTIECRTGTDVVMRGLRPDDADEIRRIVLATREVATSGDPGFAGGATADGATTPSGPEAPTADSTLDEADLLSKLIDLHRAGVLDEAELAAKTAIVGRLVRGPAD